MIISTSPPNKFQRYLVFVLYFLSVGLLILDSIYQLIKFVFYIDPIATYIYLTINILIFGLLQPILILGLDPNSRSSSQVTLCTNPSILVLSIGNLMLHAFVPNHSAKTTVKGLIGEIKKNSTLGPEYFIFPVLVFLIGIILMQMTYKCCITPISSITPFGASDQIVIVPRPRLHPEIDIPSTPVSEFNISTTIVRKIDFSKNNRSRDIIPSTSFFSNNSSSLSVENESKVKDLEQAIKGIELITSPTSNTQKTQKTQHTEGPLKEISQNLPDKLYPTPNTYKRHSNFSMVQSMFNNSLKIGDIESGWDSE